MTSILATCIPIAWAVASGPVTSYDVYKDGTFFTNVQNALIEMCREEYELVHDIYVVALNAEGDRGPNSEHLQIQWVFDFDANRDGIVGMLDFTAFGAVYGRCSSPNREIVVECTPTPTVSPTPTITPTPTPTSTPTPIADDPTQLYMSYCDDFNRSDLGVNWQVKNPNFTVDANQLVEVSGLRYQYAQVLWNGATYTADQFGRFQIMSRGDNSQGLIFRARPANGDTGPHYEVHVSGSDVKWEYVVDTSYQNRPDMCALASPVQDGNWFGATITGTSNDTTVKVFVSPTVLDPDPNNWPSPVCTLTGDPTTPVNIGNRMGIRSYTSRQIGTTFMDNVCLGDQTGGR